MSRLRARPSGKGASWLACSRPQADCAAADGELERAASLYRASIELSERVSDAITVRLDAKMGLAAVLSSLGSTDAARELAQRVRDHEDVEPDTKARAVEFLLAQ